MSIRDATFVVVDTETTGLKTPRDRLLEVAAVKVRNGEEVGRFSELVNPGCTIPRRITRMTGITTGMVISRPPAAEVLPAFMEFLGDAVFVAHNRSFDERFINSELERLERSALCCDMLCTVRLARRLLPRLESRSLGSLIHHYGISVSVRHRALADATATADILQRLIKRLEHEQGIVDLPDLLKYQYTTYSKSGRGRSSSRSRSSTASSRDSTRKEAQLAIDPRRDHLHPLREQLMEELPEAPGIYIMEDSRGNILYIGKALNLRDRVRTYFTAIRAHPPRLRKLMKEVREVRWEETPSELHALLLESRRIKEHRPRFNRADRKYRNLPFIRLAPAEDPPLSSTIAVRQEEGAEYFGPITSRRTSERAVEFLNEMDLGGNLKPIRSFLCGSDAAIMEFVEKEMHMAAEELNFELAGVLRDGLKSLQGVYARQECVGAPVGKHSGVVLQRMAENVRDETADDAESRIYLYIIARGRLRDMMTVDGPFDEDDLETLRGLVRKWLVDLDPTPDRISKSAIDEMRLLMYWLYKRRDELEWIPVHELSGRAEKSAKALEENRLDTSAPITTVREEVNKMFCHGIGAV